MLRKIVIQSFFLLAAGIVIGQTAIERKVDSVYTGLTLEEKIGQLLMIRAHSDLGPTHVTSVRNQIEKFHVGGMCFFQGTPEGHAALISQYQQLSKVPLLIAMDAEWGGGMRFRKDGLSFPRQLMLGAIQDNALIADMGGVIANQLRSIGIHVNFAPVVDINNNPLNPVINDRSFGEDRYNVTSKAFQYIRGLQSNKVMACAKHFPGHGDTDVDSHLDLPVIGYGMRRLDSLELYPFKVLIDKEVQGIMSAHLHVPAIDPEPNMPTSLSYKALTSLLREKLGFEGLIFTDAMEMKGVTKHYEPGEAELKAFLAGNDVIVLPEQIDKAYLALLDAARQGTISEERLARSVRKILGYKFALDVDQMVPAGSINQFSPRALALKSKLIESALTAVSNSDGLIPVKDISEQSIASLMIGDSEQNAFQERLASYAPVKGMAVSQDQLAGRSQQLIQLLAEEDLVVVGLAGMSNKASQNYLLKRSTLEFLTQLEAQTDVILVVFGSPYALRYLEGHQHMIMAYEDDPMVQDIAAQAVFGAFSIRGRLPVSASPSFPVNHGIQVRGAGRLSYGIPERVGMSSDTLEKIRDVVLEMINDKAAPGCQILVVKDGCVIYDEAFGYHTYQKKDLVMPTDLYDLASVTKVLGTTLAGMRLYDEGKFHPQQNLGFYLDDVMGTNKEHLVIEDVMAHQAGLRSGLPFYEETVSGSSYNRKPLPTYYRKHSDENFGIPVANNLYLRNGYVDSMWVNIIRSDVRGYGRYRYSDLGFYMLKEIVERQSGMALDTFCAGYFYHPLGLERIGYLPLNRFDVKEIVPTEEDIDFRGQRIQGHVHDEGAAMLGGVGGHAGLFSNARDLAVVMQMLMNDGFYGGIRYLQPGTVKHFASRVNRSSRRGLGFDMKELDGGRTYTSEKASANTYGHTGFTGTCVWNDPDYNLTYIFLSNRTYPTMRNNKLSRDGYRERIHTVIYDAMTN